MALHSWPKANVMSSHFSAPGLLKPPNSTPDVHCASQPRGESLSIVPNIYDAAVPMLSETALLVQSHPLIPAADRHRLAAVVRKACRWLDTCAEHAKRVDEPAPPDTAVVPFTRPNLAAAFARLTIAHLDVTEKTVANALSELNGIADRLGMPRTFALAALSPECQALQDLLVTGEDRGSCIRLLRVMSAHGIAPDHVADAVPLLQRQIDDDWKVKNKVREFKRSLYAWNHAVKAVPGWPQVPIDVPKVRRVWGQRWSEGLAALEASVDAHLALGEPCLDGEDLFAGPAVRPLSSATKRNRKLAARMAASALRDARVDIGALQHVRDLCRPDRFMVAFRVLADRAGGVTATVLRYAIDLRKLARLAGRAHVRRGGPARVGVREAPPSSSGIPEGPDGGWARNGSRTGAPRPAR